MSTIVITGANRGIGLSLCRRYVERGDSVVAACRRSSSELEALDVEIVTGADVATDEGADALASAIAGRPIDVLFLNAGILERTGLEDLDLAACRRQFEVNALGPLRVTRALLGSLGTGSKIAIVTSRMGSIGDNTSGGHYGYRMSKAAVNIAGVSLSHDLRARGVAVAILHPGFVQTDMVGGMGHVSADESAAMLAERVDELGLETSGTFWHANGEVLPW